VVHLVSAKVAIKRLNPLHMPCVHGYIVPDFCQLTQVILDRNTGQSKGFGFVRMADLASAEVAIARLNGSTFAGRRINVRPKGQQPPAPHFSRPASGMHVGPAPPPWGDAGVSAAAPLGPAPAPHGALPLSPPVPGSSGARFFLRLGFQGTIRSAAEMGMLRRITTIFAWEPVPPPAGPLPLPWGDPSALAAALLGTAPHRPLPPLLLNPGSAGGVLTLALALMVTTPAMRSGPALRWLCRQLQLQHSA
jgi:hypothetical protein